MTETTSAHNCEICSQRQCEIDELRRRVAGRDQEIEIQKAALKATGEIFQDIPTGLLVFQYQPPGELFCINGNKEAKRLTGVGVESLVGMEFDELWPNARAQGIVELFLHTARTGEQIEIDTAYFRRAFTERLFRFRVFALAGKRVGAAFEEITDKKLTEDVIQRVCKLEQRIESMTEALTLKDQLLEAATALHEPSPRSEPPRSVPKQDALANFGRYMGRILGRLKEAAQRGAEHLNCGYSSLAGAYFTQIHEEIDDALGAVRLAKQYTRVNLEGSCARIASFDLNEAVIDAIHSVSGASAISEETTCVAPRFFPVENCITHGDKREIMYVVAHLLENSYRASGGKGGVTLRTQTENGCALLHIQDGAGPGDVLGFESQWSLRVSHIGVGLELISSILKRYGGGISVRTLDGAGWTFTLKLPRVAHDESAAEPACSPEEDERNTDGAL